VDEKNTKPSSFKVKRMVEIEKKPKSSMREVKTINPDAEVRYSATVVVDTHLYKLMSAPVKKYTGHRKEIDTSPDAEPQNFLDMEHTHVYRTMDIDGNKHTKCVSIGGHYHNLELDYSGIIPKVVAMSGPMKMVSETKAGKNRLVEQPINHYDDHIHEVQYVKTEKINGHQVNMEAEKYIAMESMKGAAPAGIVE
jgi:hypothetical protein